MKKHLLFKACVLLSVMFFHSFVLVPKLYATTWEALAGRVAFRAFAPSTVAALGSGTALVVGAVVAGGIGYLIYKSGAVTALKTWLNSSLDPQYYPPPPWGTYNTWSAATGPWQFRTTQNGPSCTYFQVNSNTEYGWPSGTQGQWMVYSSCASAGDISSFVASHGGSAIPPPPTVPTDYDSSMGSTGPNFSSSQIYGSPGVAASIVGGAAIVSAVTMPDGDADRMISGLGANEITDSGTQNGVPSSNDNTVTTGDAATIGLLQQIMNYVSNFVGIKSSIDAVKTANDCVASATSALSSTVASQSGKLDNIATIGLSQSSKLDNIAVIDTAISLKMDNVVTSINAQTQAIENVETKIEHLDNTITSSVATSGTVQTRIQSLRDAAATKFPFSLASSLSVAAISGQSTYDFGSLPLTPSISITINPMAGPLADLFVWIRQMLVWLFWVGTLFAILKRGMQM